LLRHAAINDARRNSSGDLARARRPRIDAFVEEWLTVLSGLVFAVEIAIQSLRATAIPLAIFAALVLMLRLMPTSAARSPAAADRPRRCMPQLGRWLQRACGCYGVFFFYTMFWLFGAEVGSIDARAFAAGTTVHRGPVFLHDDAFRPILAVDLARRMPP
jgi:hypothetical protein